MGFFSTSHGISLLLCNLSRGISRGWQSGWGLSTIGAYIGPYRLGRSSARRVRAKTTLIWMRWPQSSSATWVQADTHLLKELICV